MSEEIIKKLRDMQAQIIHGPDFLGKAADRLYALECQLCRLINASASVLIRVPDWPELSDGGTAKAFLDGEIKSASKLVRERL